MKRAMNRFWMVFTVLALLASACSLTQTSESPGTTASPSPAAEQTASPPAQQFTPTDTVAEAVPATPTTAIEEEVIRFVILPERSEARYLVTEQLANVSLPSDAVGVTREISGTLVLLPDGTILSAESEFVVDLRNLASDQSRRDNFLRSNVLATNQYPYAVFVPTQITGLPPALPESGPVAFNLAGDLTIRDVTRQVEWEVNADLQGDELAAQARTSFTFADFNLVQPRVSIVLSIEDTIRLEIDLVMQREALASLTSTPEPGEQDTAMDPPLECASPADLTPPMAAGPFYKPDAPERSSLVEPDMGGTRLVLSGYVLAPNCEPLPNALLDFWQADDQGQYDNAGYRLRGRQYSDFLRSAMTENPPRFSFM